MMENPSKTYVKINGEEYPTRYFDKETGYFEEIQYDRKGRIISFTNPDGTETWEYLSKKWDLYTKHTFSNGAWEKWTYDEAEDWRTLPPILTSYYNSMGVMTTIRDCRTRETSNDDLIIINDTFPHLMQYGVVKGALYLKSRTNLDVDICPDFKEPYRGFPKSKLLKTVHSKTVHLRADIMESIETIGESVIRKGSRRHTYNVRVGVSRVVVELTDKSINKDAKYVYWTQWVFDKEMNLLSKVEEKQVSPTYNPPRPVFNKAEKDKIKRTKPLKSASPTVLYFDEYDRNDYGIPASVYSACKEYEDLATIVNYDYD